MYLHIGGDTMIKSGNIVGIFDLDNTTTSKITRNYLSSHEKSGRIKTVTYDLPKSFVLCMEDGETVIYLSQMNTSTLIKRLGSAGNNIPNNRKK
ncbi:MAG: DUF370 domain-containing protein [Oscillospiraceae bacterium]|jgi:hypothetical protein|nr:DUF370 domain-containing protein [Oscillospiraceae bacterium]